MDTMRLFVACDFSSETLDKVAAVARELRIALPGAPVRWVSSTNYHLTLQFLGELPLGKIEAIKAALRELASNHRAISLELAGAGCFPSLMQPQVIWLGIRPNPALIRLAEDIRRTLGSLGYKDESKFKAHLTLGRLDKFSTEEQKARVGAKVALIKESIIGADQFNEIILYRSILNPGGPVYTALFCQGKIEMS